MIYPHLKINMELVRRKFTSDLGLKYLHMYLKTGLLCRGSGWYDKKDYIDAMTENTGYTVQNVYRWIGKMYNAGLLIDKGLDNGKIVIKGMGRLTKEFNQENKDNPLGTRRKLVVPEDIIIGNHKDFCNFIIEAFAAYKQKSIEIAVLKQQDKSSSNNPKDFSESGLKLTDCVKNANNLERMFVQARGRAGCSYLLLSQYLGMPKTTLIDMYSGGAKNKRLVRVCYRMGLEEFSKQSNEFKQNVFEGDRFSMKMGGQAGNRYYDIYFRLSDRWHSEAEIRV